MKKLKYFIIFSINMWKIFRISKDEEHLYQQLLKDEITSKLSVAKREAVGLGLQGNDIYIIVEGDENIIARASQILQGKEVSREDSEKIYKIYQEQLESAQQGVGFIFGC